MRILGKCAECKLADVFARQDYEQDPSCTEAIIEGGTVAIGKCRWEEFAYVPKATPTGQMRMKLDLVKCEAHPATLIDYLLEVVSKPSDALPAELDEDEEEEVVVAPRGFGLPFFIRHHFCMNWQAQQFMDCIQPSTWTCRACDGLCMKLCICIPE